MGWSVQIGLLPSAHGTRSALTPQRGQFTPRMEYTKNTRIPQKGMNSNRRGGNMS